MACCTLPSNLRYCKDCGEPLLTETRLAALVFVDTTNTMISECPNCGHWLNDTTTSETPVVVVSSLESAPVSGD